MFKLLEEAIKLLEEVLGTGGPLVLISVMSLMVAVLLALLLILVLVRR